MTLSPQCRRAAEFERSFGAEAGLSEAELEWLADHLASCADCTPELAQLEAALATCGDSLPDTEYFGQQRAEIMAQVHAEPAGRSFALGAFAAVALAAGLATFLVFRVPTQVQVADREPLDFSFTQMEIASVTDSRLFSARTIFDVEFDVGIEDLDDTELDELGGLLGASNEWG
jgi:hypothetical protein